MKTPSFFALALVVASLSAAGTLVASVAHATSCTEAKMKVSNLETEITHDLACVTVTVEARPCSKETVLTITNGCDFDLTLESPLCTPGELTCTLSSASGVEDVREEEQEGQVDVTYDLAADGSPLQLRVRYDVEYVQPRDETGCSAGGSVAPSTRRGSLGVAGALIIAGFAAAARSRRPRH